LYRSKISFVQLALGRFVLGNGQVGRGCAYISGVEMVAGRIHFCLWLCVALFGFNTEDTEKSHSEHREFFGGGRLLMEEERSSSLSDDSDFVASPGWMRASFFCNAKERTAACHKTGSLYNCG